ncbi:MAG: hypothetical protein WC146_01675 [Patescibacteria group bacterium]
MLKIIRVFLSFSALVLITVFFRPVVVQAGVCDVYVYDSNYNKNNQVSTVCSGESKFTLTLRNFSGEILAGFKFELYEQGSDANGLPFPVKKVGGGTIDGSGQASFSFKPDQCKPYALKVWDKKQDLGEFWFFDAVHFTCDYNRSLIKNLPALKISLRDASGELKKNQRFSLYAQKYDADNNPVFEKNGLIANLETGASGQAVVYVAPYNIYRRGQTGFYALSMKDAANKDVFVYNISIPGDRDYSFSYSFSGVSGELRDINNHLLSAREVRLYEQLSSGSGYSLGKELAKKNTGADGRFQFEYPAGTYALAVKDDFNRNNIFWNVAIKSGSAYQKLILSSVNFSLSDAQGEELPREATIKIYSLMRAADGFFYRDKEIGSLKLTANRTGSSSLSSGPYLAVYVGKNNKEYGQTFYAQNGSSRAVKLIVSSKYFVSAGQSFKVSGSTVSQLGGTSTSSSASTAPAPVPSPGSLASRLRGRILLQVEGQGQAWYVNPLNGRKYYLGRPSDAFEIMRRFGLGISNSDFSSLEKNPYSWKQLAGRILLKTEDSGKAYYFDPVNFRLHYLGRPSDAFNVMRSQGLGIKNSDLSDIPSGS